MIANAGFERGTETTNQNSLNTPYGYTATFNREGWTNSGIITQNPSEGNNGYEMWAGDFKDANLHQVVILPTGKYTLSGEMRTDANNNINNQVVYAKVDETTYTSGTITSVASTWNGPNSWNTLSKSFYVTADNTQVELGFSSNAFFQADNFTLTYNGAVSKVATTFSQKSAISVTSNKWYAVEISLAGDYKINTNVATEFYYTTTGHESPGDVTEHWSLQSGDNTKTFSVGTYYFRSSSEATINIYPASEIYVVGDATVSHSYIQGGETVTVSYLDANTNSGNSLSVSTEGVKFNGSTPANLTATANGFTFTVPSGLSAATDYTLNIPAGIVGYAAGSTYNESQEIIIKTPSVFNGTYFFKTDANKYLNRGSDWGTRACVDDWGLPVEVSTDAAGGSTLTFYDVTDRYIYNSGSNIWTDATSKSDATTWYISKLSNGKYRLQSAQQSGKFVKMDSGDDRIYSDGTNENLIVDWTLENPSFHVAQMQAVKDAQAASAASAAGLSNISTVSALATAVASMNASAVITPSKVTSTAEKYQSQSGDIYDKQTIHIPTAGLYKFTIQGFSRIANNDRTYSIHMAGGDVPPVYAYFAGAKTLMTSPFDLEGQTAYSTDCVEKGGYYYPNGQTSAKKFFQDGKFENTIWVYISDAGDYTYGITNIGNSKTNHQQWTCYTTESVSLTLYFSGSLDYVDDGVHYYKGSFAQAPAITLTDTEPVADIQGANFTSGSSALTFNNPNGLVFASSNGQVSSTTKNVVVNGTCASLHLEDSHPFMNPKEFTATKASYTMSAVASGKNYNSENVSMGTLMVPFAASLPSGGSAYTLDQGVNLMDGNIRGTEVSSIAANSPVLVTAEGGYTGSNVTIPVVNNGATYTNGELVGTYTAMTAVEGSYVLQNHTSGEGVAFYLVGSTQPMVNPFRAYIKSQGSNARTLHVVFDDEAQGITNLNDINDNLNGEVYDLQGRRVAQPTKGLYIVNGRKTVIK